MELRVQLKICEGCGCLWFRTQNHGNVYCKQCEHRLKEFPAPDSRKRVGRPVRKPILKAWDLAKVGGGAE